MVCVIILYDFLFATGIIIISVEHIIAKQSSWTESQLKIVVEYFKCFFPRFLIISLNRNLFIVLSQKFYYRLMYFLF